jgi:hypothetical protein
VVPDTEVTETGKDEGEISNTPVPTLGRGRGNSGLRLLTLLMLIKDPSLRGLRGNQDRQKFDF